MKHTLLIKDWLYSFLFLLFPRCCVVCGRSLVKGEECICTLCNLNLPRTNYHLREDNPVERLFWGRIPLGHATSFFFYRKGSDFRQIPVPLHKKKQQIRGYNQSEWIARGITAVTGIPVDTEMIVRRKNTETQTHKSVFERWENVDGIFELHHVGALAGKHILLVDDVLTTGATTAACAACLAEIEGIHISILTLAIAE